MLITLPRTYPKKSKSMAENLAWIKDQRPQKKCEAWAKKGEWQRVARKISMWSSCQWMSLLITKQRSPKHTQKQAEALWQQGKKADIERQLLCDCPSSTLPSFPLDGKHSRLWLKGQKKGPWGFCSYYYQVASHTGGSINKNNHKHLLK